MRENLILKTDSYKASHFLQYPPNTTGYFGYIEARKPLTRVEPFSETVFFGLQIMLERYLSERITLDDIDEAEKFFKAHGEPFNKAGWQYILEKYKGYIPITIKAVPEGMVIPEGNALVTVECDDPKCFWVASYFETLLLRACWYGSTVATNSRECKKVLMKYLKLSSDNPEQEIQFKLHDFGARGVSSGESAGIGGAAHLVNFKGSDTIEGALVANHYYNCDMASFSIPASEHSTITSWGKENEVEAYRNMIKQFGGEGKIFACVSDSYNIYDACRVLWGGLLHNEVLNSKGLLVIRPDSGNPAEVVLKCLQILCGKFGYTLNKKGYKVLNNVRVIQGDGININSIREICNAITQEKFSLDNVNFGMGGALLQHLNRDTLRFAMKCSAIRIGDEWKDVFKSPMGDKTKESKKGILSIYKFGIGHSCAVGYVTGLKDHFEKDGFYKDVLIPVYVNGEMMNASTFDQVRERAKL